MSEHIIIQNEAKCLKCGDIDAKTNKMVYHKDHRTDMCFAFLASRKANLVGVGNMTGMGMANVPCTEEVLKLIR